MKQPVSQYIAINYFANVSVKRWAKTKSWANRRKGNCWWNIWDLWDWKHQPKPNRRSSTSFPAISWKQFGKHMYCSQNDMQCFAKIWSQKLAGNSSILKYIQIYKPNKLCMKILLLLILASINNYPLINGIFNKIYYLKGGLAHRVSNRNWVFFFKVKC